MFQPKRTKYRKQQKGRNTGVANRGNTVSFGTYGLKATTRGQITSGSRIGEPWGACTETISP